MEKDILPDLMIIDDDPVNNMLCCKIIQQTIPGAAVKTFTLPEKGLEHILATYSAADAKKAILFLDINMPHLTGWEVLDRMNYFPEEVKERLRIFMLSSSVAPDDKERADRAPLVTGYMAKPLSRVKLQELYSEWLRAF